MDEMGSELGLDLKLSAMKSVSSFSKEASASGDSSARAARLESYVQSLEEEKRKMESFRRELPISILIISHVLSGMREELEQCRGERCAALEEFMPMKGKFEEEGGAEPEKDHRDKMNWMSSAQLWSENCNDNNSSNDNNGKRKTDETVDEADGRFESKSVCIESKARSGGAFFPFKGVPISGLVASKEEKPLVMMSDLSLVPPAIRVSQMVSDVKEDSRCLSSAPKTAAARACAALGAQLGLQAQQQQQQQQQPPRKARRCWSPELHRRFVIALQQLGGAQVATPKQIRELMKVDGLTNDEVKSHLQKYRLHSRRMPKSSSATNKPVVVVGGLWAPQDQYSTSQKSASLSGSPEGPLQLASSTRAVSVTAGDSYEEDGKSESYSWK